MIDELKRIRLDLSNAYDRVDELIKNCYVHTIRGYVKREVNPCNFPVWAAMDKDGEWYIHEEEPGIDMHDNWSNRGWSSFVRAEVPYQGDWTRSKVMIHRGEEL